MAIVSKLTGYRSVGTTAKLYSSSGKEEKMMTLG